MKTLKNTYFWTILLAFFLQTGFGQAKYQDVYTVPAGEKVITATATTNQQNLAFTGIIRSAYAVSPTAPSYQMFVRKTEANGNVLFYRTIDTDGELYPNSINQTEDEGFIISGTVTYQSKNMTTMFLLKITKDGQVDWLKYYERNIITFGIHSLYSELNYAEEVYQLGYIATGVTEIIDPQTHQTYYATIVLLTDDKGNLVNRKILNSGQSSSGVTIKQADFGNFALLIKSLTSNEQPSVVLLDLNLNEIWNKTISQVNNHLSPRDLVVTSRAEIVVGTMLYDMTLGHTYAAMISLDLHTGGMSWQKSYYWKSKHDTYFPESIKQAENGDLYLAGEVAYDTPSGNWEEDVFVLQTDAQGQLKRLTQYGQENRPEYVQEISLFDNGAFFFGGFTDYFNSGGYLVKADGKGDTNCDFSYQEGRLANYSYTAQSKTLETISSNIYTHKVIANNEYADSEINRCGEDMARGKIGVEDNGPAIQLTNNLMLDKETSTVYPNPNTGSFNLVLPKMDSQKITSVQLYNANGQIVKELDTNNNRQTYDFQDYPKGIYFLKVTTGNQTESHKIMVQ